MLNHQQVPHLFRPSSMEKILQQPSVYLMITTCSPLWCDVSTRALSEASPRFDAPNHVREHSVEVRRHRQGKTRPFQQALQNKLLEVHNSKVKEREREHIYKFLYGISNGTLSGRNPTYNNLVIRIEKTNKKQRDPKVLVCSGPKLLPSKTSKPWLRKHEATFWKSNENRNNKTTKGGLKRSGWAC